MIGRYAASLFLMLLSAAVYATFIEPTYRDIAVQKESVATLEGYLADAGKASDEIKAISDQHEKFPVDGPRRLAVLLPSSFDPIRTLIDLNALALRHGISVRTPSVSSNDTQSTTAAPSTEKGKVVAHTVSFTTTATLKVFREFVTDIEHSLALRDISKISFSRSGTGDSGTSVNPELSVYDFTIVYTMYSTH